MELFFLIVVLCLILFAEVVNGWTDAPNAIATVVSTRTLSLRTAIVCATLFNIAGAFSGTAVAATIGTGIIRPEAVDLVTIAAAMMSIIAWSILAWSYGIPTSESHALVAGLTGAGLAAAGPGVLLWEGWQKVLIGLFFSTLLGFSSGWIMTKAIKLSFGDTAPSRSRKLFGWLQMFSASFMAFSHGSNDGQKFIGAFALALYLGGIFPNFYIPYWVIVLCAFTMGVGTMIGGFRIIKTMGLKIIHLETYQGFSAETSAAVTIQTASAFGIPLSTTHTIGTSIVGVGVAKNPKAVSWQIVLNVVYAWLLTFPICGLLSFIVAWAFNLIFK